MGEFIDRWNKDLARWYAAQTDAYLRTLMNGAWCANNVDGFSNARAEICRRKHGGTFFEHLTIEWGWPSNNENARGS